MIEGIGLTKRFGFGDAAVVAIDSVDIHIEERELVMIMGDSGCGKTTLISLLGCILTPDSGELHIDGEEIDLNGQDLSLIRRQKIGFVFQLFHLLPYLTALENVMVAMDIAKTDTSEAENRAIELLTRVGLSDRLHHRPAQMSGGEKQRVSFARALANRPKVIFADEPTANLDSRQSDNLMNLIQELRQEHQTTVVIVTHHEGLKENADRIVYMKDGKVIAS
ncbi:ABC transporter ATP-binding protein [Candidatus Poribacteria bacterium]|nr:ABC transporter ATP-binding protein [Candidatus Poribacteria bacterium]MYB65634.1 ABC transporter ATP-binding protein [Candidatus Poribacteria bacterium]MYF56384.1 ABC transporter ATP-binding protein [Candidatus Poribacteria bacterium]MYI94121.1 ABC transporter ATP-binding protein [Candidatus Poribacteria bacterium]